MEKPETAWPIFQGRDPNPERIKSLPAAPPWRRFNRAARKERGTKYIPMGPEVEMVNAALSDAQVVISCAGPFAKFGEPVLRAALHAGAHYVDTTGEQGV